MALHWILHVGILMLGLARADNDEFQQDNPYCSGDIGCQSPTQAAGGNMYTESSQVGSLEINIRKLCNNYV